MIAGCLQLAEYVVERLKELEKEISTELWIHRSTLSLAVVFRKPNNELVYKYSLFCKTVYVNNEERHYCHVYVMPSVTQEMIDQLIDGLKIQMPLCNQPYYFLDKKSLFLKNILFNIK